MKKNLNRTVALALAVMLVVCFPFAVSGEEAAAEIPVQTEEVIEVPETVEPAVEENVPQPVSVWIITLNLGSTEFYYDDLMLGANIENATAAGIRWQICKTYNRDGANDWKDYKYDEVIHVTVEPGIENWAFRCILPSGDMSQEFVVTKNFGYRPAEEEITEETVPEESTETTEEMIVESEEIEEETDDDDFVEFADDELVEFDDNDWGTTEGSDFSELDNLANGVEENAAEAETEEVAEETETEEEIEEVTEEAEAETPAAEAEEIADVVVEEEKEEANEEIEEVTEEAETETPAAEAEEIADVVVEEEKEEAIEEIEEVTEETETETPAVEAETVTEEEQTEVENAEIEGNLPDETEEISEETEEVTEEVTEEAETETPVVEDEEVIEEEQTEVINVEMEEIIPEETEESTEEIEEVTEEAETETPAVEVEATIEEDSEKKFEETESFAKENDVNDENKTVYLYIRDENGNLVLDEHGDPVVEAPENAMIPVAFLRNTERQLVLDEEGNPIPTEFVNADAVNVLTIEDALDSNRSIDVFMSYDNAPVINVGTPITVTAVLHGYDNVRYNLQWQSSNDNGATWTDVENATERNYTYPISIDNFAMIWRVIVTPYEIIE